MKEPNISKLLFGVWRRCFFVFCIVLLVVSANLLTYLDFSSAAQITNRSLSISSSIPSASGVTYTYNFQPGTAGAVQSMFFQSCTTAVGTCTVPTGINLSGGTPSLSGFAGSVSGLTKNTSNSSPACNVTSNMCINWTDATSQTTSSPLTITVTNEVNPSGSTCATTNCSFYVRIITYSDTAYTTNVDNGTVASSVTQTLTLNATVSEQLSICVGSANGNSATVETMAYSMPACSAITGTSLNIGSLTPTVTSVSPMATAQPYNGDLNNAVVEVSTNAANGLNVEYAAVQQSGTNHQGALRVPGATCSAGTSYTDQCINSIGATSANIVTGTEAFGMAVTGINCTNVPGTAYTCNSTTHNLVLNSNYNCNSTDAATSFSSFDSGGQITGTSTCKYAWDESGTFDSIATSANVVGGEAMVIEFAATPEITTPTGAYSAQAEYVAIPTF